MQVQRWRFAGDRLDVDGVVIGGITMGTIHSSGRVRFGPDGAMYVGAGDAGDGGGPSRRPSLNGKILRVAPGAFRGGTVTPHDLRHSASATPRASPGSPARAASSRPTTARAASTGRAATTSST